MANKFKETKIRAEILGDLCEKLDSEEKSLQQKWSVVGKETVQAKHWRTEELLWEDEAKTIPKYANKYAAEPKEDADYTEDERIRLNVIRGIKTQLEKML